MKTTKETIVHYVKRKGLKHKIVAQSMDMKATTWYKNVKVVAKMCLLKEISKLATFLKISPYKAFELTYNHFYQTKNQQG